MRRFAKSWMFVAVAVSLSVAGCKKKKDDAPAAAPVATDKAPTTPEPAKTEPPKTEPAATAPAAGSNDDMALLPVDSDIVLQFNFAQLQASPLYALVKDKIEAEAAEGIAKFKDKCGWDPMSTVQTVSLGMKAGPDGKKPESMAIVIHGPSKAQVMDCMAKAKDEAAAKGTTLTIDGDNVFMQKTGEPGGMGITFAGDTTAFMLANMSAPVTGDQLKAAMSAGGLKASQAFMDIYGKLPTGKTLSMFINGKSPMMNQMAAMGAKPMAMFGTVDITDGLALDFRMRLDTPEAATQMAGMAKGQSQALDMFGIKTTKFEVTSDASDVRVEMVMTKDQLTQTIDNFKSKMGGAMGH